MAHIIKRRGHNQAFDSRKVYGSVYFSCRNAHLTEIQSEKIADQVSKAIEQWVSKKKQISSQEIFEKIASILRSLDEDAAFLYATHRDIS